MIFFLFWIIELSRAFWEQFASGKRRYGLGLFWRILDGHPHNRPVPLGLQEPREWGEWENNVKRKKMGKKRRKEEGENEEGGGRRRWVFFPATISRHLLTSGRLRAKTPGPMNGGRSGVEWSRVDEAGCKEEAVMKRKGEKRRHNFRKFQTPYLFTRSTTPPSPPSFLPFFHPSSVALTTA